MRGCGSTKIEVAARKYAAEKRDKSHGVRCLCERCIREFNIRCEAYTAGFQAKTGDAE